MDQVGAAAKNKDLWQLVDRVLAALERADVQLTPKHVPAHVGVYGNEKADRLAKAAAKRAHKAASRTAEEQLDRQLETMADDIVAACLTRLFA